LKAAAGLRFASGERDIDKGGRSAGHTLREIPRLVERLVQGFDVNVWGYPLPALRWQCPFF